MKLIIDMEDPDIMLDLRALNGKQGTQYDTFWNECEKFLNEDVVTAVDDRRHCSITHLSRVISMRDLVEEVGKHCPEGTCIPSIEWVRLQFWPKTPSLKSLQYTGRYKIRYMVQQRQWRKEHMDSHYAACLYRYMREYAILVREFCLFISIDDKHKIPVGEPNFPIAAVERGKRVPVRNDEVLMVGDHDFNKFSLIPSVVFIINIPEEISESWFTGIFTNTIFKVCPIYFIRTNSIIEGDI